jgi:hypothetical protein
VTARGPVIALAIAASILLQTSCAGPRKPVSLGAPKKAPPADDYKSWLKRWTRSTTLLRQFTTALTVFATLRSPQFEAAYIAKREKVFHLPKRTVAELRSNYQASWKDELTFVVVAATHDLAWNDFDRKDSQWRLFLSNDAGDQVDPKKVRLQRRITETDREFFPHIDMFYQLYHISFPKTLPDGRPLIKKGIRKLSLRFTGAIGTAELSWSIKQ